LTFNGLHGVIIPEYSTLLNHRFENLKSYKYFLDKQCVASVLILNALHIIFLGLFILLISNVTSPGRHNVSFVMASTARFSVIYLLKGFSVLATFMCESDERMKKIVTKSALLVLLQDK
jgi:hypothetical protein